MQTKPAPCAILSPPIDAVTIYHSVTTGRTCVASDHGLPSVQGTYAGDVPFEGVVAAKSY